MVPAVTAHAVAPGEVGQAWAGVSESKTTMAMPLSAEIATQWLVMNPGMLETRPPSGH